MKLKINEFGDRITTYVLTFPRFILSEYNTHRMLSKNSASSRAIPFSKMLKSVEEDPFIPIKFMIGHKGMQGTEYFTGKSMIYDSDGVLGNDIDVLTHEWLLARDNAVKQAKFMSEKGLTKQICNRLLEPFLWHKIICTGTEWENFFALRAHEAAEIHIQELAYKMLEAYNNSNPVELNPGEWHIPFGDKFDSDKIQQIKTLDQQNEDLIKVKIATARCGRVSYMNFDGSDDYQKDIDLHDRLLTSGHLSPFEHCAIAMSKSDLMSNYNVKNNKEDFGWSGNFKGFIQYRKTFDNENQKDDRVNKLGNVIVKV